jgi:hypothetical protein
VVEPIKAQNNMWLPIVVEPIEAQNNIELRTHCARACWGKKYITDLSTVAISNTDLSIGVEHNRQFQLLIYVRRGWREVRYHIVDYAENFQ